MPLIQYNAFLITINIRCWFGVKFLVGSIRSVSVNAGSDSVSFGKLQDRKQSHPVATHTMPYNDPSQRCNQSVLHIKTT